MRLQHPISIIVSVPLVTLLRVTLSLTKNLHTEAAFLTALPKVAPFCGDDPSSWGIKRRSPSRNGITATLDDNSSSLSASSHESDSADHRSAIAWITGESLDSLLPKDDSLAICSELLSNDELINDSELLVTKNWDKLENKLQKETRSIRDLLGEATTEKVLDSVRSLDSYDSDTVRAFLSSDAVNDLFAKLLYDGIYEFFQTIDVFGNVISKLPIIGPIRNQIRDGVKKNLDQTLRPLLKNFLKGYTKVAVIEATNFVMSSSNRNAFGNANANLVSSVLDRPLNSLFQEETTSALVKLRKDAFEYIRNARNMEEDLEKYVSFVYDLIGDKSIDNALNFDKVLDASPTLDKTVAVIWEKAIAAAAADDVNIQN